MGLALGLIFMSLSSAPFLAAGLQVMMIAWDRIFAFLRARWVILVVLGTSLLAALQAFTPDGLVAFVFDNFLLMPQTGYGRLGILYWGSLSVIEHPFFGVGQGDWVRAYDMGHPTVDNFWLLTAMKYGLPALLLLWFSVAVNTLGILAQTRLDPEEQRQRRGYLITLAGLVMILATVAIWGPVSTFVLTYFGAGVWFYTQGEGSGAATGPRARAPGPVRRRIAPGALPPAEDAPLPVWPQVPRPGTGPRRGAPATARAAERPDWDRRRPRPDSGRRRPD
jgi:hypothetical protein